MRPTFCDPLLLSSSVVLMLGDAMLATPELSLTFLSSGSSPPKAYVPLAVAFGTRMKALFGLTQLHVGQACLEFPSITMRLQRQARKVGKFLATDLLSENPPTEKSDDHRIKTSLGWWAWVDLNHGR